MTVSNELQFHLQGIDQRNKAWENLEIVFGKHNDIWGHHLENELVSLNTSEFSCIKGYLYKFKTLKLLVEECKIPKSNIQCNYVLAKFGSPYFFVVSIFHSIKEVVGSSNKYPTLEYFCNCLVRKQDKLFHLGVVNTLDTSSKALVAQ